MCKLFIADSFSRFDFTKDMVKTALGSFSNTCFCLTLLLLQKVILLKTVLFCKLNKISKFESSCQNIAVNFLNIFEN